MKKEYKNPSIEVVRMEQMLLSVSDPNSHNEQGGSGQFSPRMGRGKNGLDEDEELDEEEDW